MQPQGSFRDACHCRSRTTPPTADTLLGDEDGVPRRFHSAPAGTTREWPLDTPDSSEFRSESTESSLADRISPVDSLELGSTHERESGIPQPGETVEPIELTTGDEAKSAGPRAPRPGMGDRPVSRGADSRPSTGRPGSDRHPVLPPISPKISQTPPGY